MQRKFVKSLLYTALVFLALWDISVKKSFWCLQLFHLRGFTVCKCLWPSGLSCDCDWQVLDIIIDVFNKKGDPALDIPAPASECPVPPKITQWVLQAKVFLINCTFPHQLLSVLYLPKSYSECYKLKCPDQLYIPPPASECPVPPKITQWVLQAKVSWSFWHSPTSLWVSRTSQNHTVSVTS